MFLAQVCWLVAAELIQVNAREEELSEGVEKLLLGVELVLMLLLEKE